MIERVLGVAVPEAGIEVQARLVEAEAQRALCVLAHGAGAGIDHGSMASAARALALAGVSSLRYHFPYRERGHGRPDPPPLLQATVRAATEHARRIAPAVPLLLGGRSMGGRMSSEAQAAQPEPGVRGLVFFAFPLHPPKRPAITRARHLGAVTVPMLFLSGDRDDLAQLSLLEGVCSRLERATLHVVADADHSFRLRQRSGRTAGDVESELAAAIRRFVDSIR